VKQPNGLIACQAISNGALAADALPERIKLLNWGSNPSLKGDIVVGPRTLSSLSANQKKFGFDKVGIDYEHQSVDGHKNFKPAPREYAAYGIPEIVENDGLYLTALSWTPSGEQNARNYCDLSPVVLRQDGEVIFLHSTALCPQGAVEGLEFFTPDFQPKQNTDTTMNADLRKLLSTLFEVPADADEAAILSAGQAFADKISKLLNPAGSGSEKKSEPDKVDLTALSARIEDLSKQFDASTRSNLLAAALREGKLVPNSAKDLPLDKLTSLIAELPANQVPLEKRTPEHVQATGLDSLSATDLEVARQLGLKPEDMVAK
jgi:phage I-like protein